MESVKDKDHLIDLADGWLLWKTVCLRGAGFPIHMLEELAANDAAAAIDRFLDLEAAWIEARDRALHACRDATRSLGPEARKPYRRAIRLLTKGRVPEPMPNSTETSTMFATLALASQERDAARCRAADSITDGRRRVSANLREICHNPLFREAIIWQNRQVLHDSVDVLARMGANVQNQNRRRHEELVFNYVQRYCAKNETIGFFGPAAWTRFADQGPPITMEPGPGLLSTRRMHFEYWAIDALAEVLSNDRDVLPWLTPRLNPNIRVEDDGRLHSPNNEPARLQPQAVHLLAACDGETQAVDIADRLGTGPNAEFRSPAHVLRYLMEMKKKRIILWNAYVPVVPQADRWLHRVLMGIRDPAVRQRSMAPLVELLEGRASVEASRGDPAALNSAMAALETTFQRVTGTKPTRHAGSVYGGRTMLYEDCRRGVEVVLGPEIRHRLGPPFSLVLRGANWYLHYIGTRFTEFLDGVFAQFSTRSGGAPVSFDAMVMRNPEVWRAGWAIIDDAVKEHERRWRSIFDFEEGARRVHLGVDDIRDEVFALFPESPLHWPGAKYHSPDLMIAAETAEEICQGRFLLVLGEFNAGVNRMGLPALSLLHPNPDDITRFLNDDLRRPRIVRVPHRHSKGHRAVFDTLSPSDFHITVNDTPSWRDKEQVLPVSDLIVEKSDRGLIVKTRDGARRFHIADIFSLLLGPKYWEQISLLPTVAHVPRITIDELVIFREQWSFPCGDVPFAHLPSTEERFIGARRLIRGHGIPRWAFARVPFEKKPYYVDFENPVSVDSLAKVIRRGAEKDAATPVTLGEMLPTPEQCWLRDAEGNRYTSELRLAVVNPETWHPSEIPSS